MDQDGLQLLFEAVIAERGGSLGFNLKLVLETSEERGSTGLRQFVAGQADRLVASVLIASDGPRVMPEVPTIATGTRGIFNFDLVMNLRPGGVHSGHWGGLTTDPALPYAKPPLSKAYLCGRQAKLDLHSPGWFVRHDVELQRGITVDHIDLARREVVTEAALTLRSFADAVILRMAARSADAAVVIGGGLIGCVVRFSWSTISAATNTTRPSM